MDSFWLDVAFKHGPGSLVPEPNAAWRLGFTSKGFSLVAEPRKRWRRHKERVLLRQAAWPEVRHISVDAEPIDGRPVLHLRLDSGDLAFLVEPLPWDLVLTLRHVFRSWAGVNDKLLRTDWTAPRTEPAAMPSGAIAPAT